MWPRSDCFWCHLIGKWQCEQPESHGICSFTTIFVSRSETDTNHIIKSFCFFPICPQSEQASNPNWNLKWLQCARLINSESQIKTNWMGNGCAHHPDILNAACTPESIHIATLSLVHWGGSLGFTASPECDTHSPPLHSSPCPRSAAAPLHKNP